MCQLCGIVTLFLRFQSSQQLSAEYARILSNSVITRGSLSREITCTLVCNAYYKYKFNWKLKLIESANRAVTLLQICSCRDNGIRRLPKLLEDQMEPRGGSVGIVTRL